MNLLGKSNQIIAIVIAQNRRYEEVQTPPPPIPEASSNNFSSDKLGGLGIFVACVAFVFKTAASAWIDISKKRAEQALQINAKEAESKAKEAASKLKEVDSKVKSEQEQIHVLMDLVKENSTSIQVLLQTTVAANLNSNQMFFDELKGLNENFSKLAQEFAVFNVQLTAIHNVLNETYTICRINLGNIVDIERALDIPVKSLELPKAHDDDSIKN